MSSSKYNKMEYTCFILILGLVYTLGTESDGGEEPTATDVPPPPPPPKTVDPGPPRACSVSGRMCVDCMTQAVCIGNPDGTFNRVVQSCPPGSVCLSGVCAKEHLCNYRPFKCADTGPYPDPWDCTKYHFCLSSENGTELTQMDEHCPAGSSYDVASSSCTGLLNSTDCAGSPVPECHHSFQVGPVPSNPAIYYVCMEEGWTISPILFRCSAGNVFNSKKCSCVPEKKKKSKS